MASTTAVATTFLLLLLAATFTSACPTCPKPKAKPKPKPKPKPIPKPCPSPPIIPSPTPPVIPSPTPPVIPSPPKPAAKCPLDTLKLGVCADLLGLVSIVVGSPASGSPCCALISGLADAEAALCLCTAIKANVLGVVKLDVPVAISLLLSACQKTIPPGFKC